MRLVVITIFKTSIRKFQFTVVECFNRSDKLQQFLITVCRNTKPIIEQAVGLSPGISHYVLKCFGRTILPLKNMLFYGAVQMKRIVQFCSFIDFF